MKLFYFGYIGKQGSGKDTVCEIIKKIWKFDDQNRAISHYRTAFADPLKEDIKKKLELDISTKTPLVRQLLQTYGLLMREKFGGNYWQKRTEKKVKLLVEKLNEHLGKDEIAVLHFTDVRFEEEHKWLKSQDNHILFKIDATRDTRKNRILQRKTGEDLCGEDHPSETAQDCLDANVIIDNNVPMVELMACISNIIKDINKQDVHHFINNT